jgi:adenylate kinase family enzyme
VHESEDGVGPERTGRLGRYIAIYGNSGSGKTTLARELGAALGLPVVELDAIYHARPNWQDLALPEFRARVAEVLEAHRDGWVIDGNYGGVRDLILTRAHTAIWLKLPFRTVYWRLCYRTITRTIEGGELWNGNRETWQQTFLSSDSMLVWGIKSWRSSRLKTREAVRSRPAGVRLFVLRTPREVTEFVARTRREGASS